MLTPESIETPTSEKKMIGSVLIMEAKNMATVRKAIKDDIYYTSSVVSNFELFLHPPSLYKSLQWDLEKILITPWVPAHFP